MLKQVRDSNRGKATGWALTALAALVIIAIIPWTCGEREPITSDPAGGLPHVSSAGGADGAAGLVPLGMKGLGDGPASLRSALGRGTGAGDQVATVATLAGEASAERVGREPRPLACGDPVYAGERVLTAEDSRLGLISDEAFVQLDADTALLVGLTPEGVLDMTLEAGRVRVIDLRETGPSLRLAVGQAETAVIGNDVDAFFGDSATFAANGSAGVFCPRDRALEVVSGARRITAGPGACVGVPAEESLLTTVASTQSLPLAGPEEECPVGGVLGALASRFLPIDAAIGAGPDGFGTPPFPDGPERDSCGDPGSPACGLLALVSPGGSGPRGPRGVGPPSGKRGNPLPGPLRSLIPPRGVGPGGFALNKDPSLPPHGNGPGRRTGPKMGANIFSKSFAHKP